MRDAHDRTADGPRPEVGGIGHGADPVAPEFGARRLSARGAVGHSDYFEPGAQSLGTFAAAGVGAYRSLVCAPADGSCHDGISGAEGRRRA